MSISPAGATSDRPLRAPSSRLLVWTPDCGHRLALYRHLERLRRRGAARIALDRAIQGWYGDVMDKNLEVGTRRKTPIRRKDIYELLVKIGVDDRQGDDIVIRSAAPLTDAIFELFYGESDE